jgi:signal transduction histidine kinase
VKFHVTDTGRGVAHEDLEKIFNRFVQGKDHKAGSGLGLAICKGLVTQMGGRIGVESELGAGSTFYFTLPVSKSTQS